MNMTSNSGAPTGGWTLWANIAIITLAFVIGVYVGRDRLQSDIVRVENRLYAHEMGIHSASVSRETIELRFSEIIRRLTIIENKIDQ